MVLAERHSSCGFIETKISILSKPFTSVPSSGRPICGTTSTTSGISFKRARILRASSVEASKEMVDGAVARIYNEPSFKLGKNSRPIPHIKITRTTVKAIPAFKFNIGMRAIRFAHSVHFAVIFSIHRSILEGSDKPIGRFFHARGINKNVPS